MRVFKQQYKDRKGKTRDSAKWYVEIKDHNETVRRIPGFTDNKATQEFGRRLEKLVAVRTLGDTPGPDLSRWLETLPSDTRKRLAKYGLLDARTVANSKPLSEHLADFHASLLHKNRTVDHADVQRARARNILDGCKFSQFSDISAARVERFLSDERDNGNGMSAQTSNYYLQAFKQFCNWMVKERRVSESPVAHLTGVNAKLDRRRERRNLTAEELATLLETTVAAATHHRLDGLARTMLYRTAMETGLRRNELRSLTPSCIDFDAEMPVIVVQPANVKNRKPTVQAIRRELADELRRWILNADIGPESRLWGDLTKNTAKMLKVDQEAAGIAYVDDAGLYADFHALRHSYISLITQGGVHPKLAQKLARHSDINLTMSRYSHTLLVDESEALNVLPEFPSAFDGSDDQRQALRATGTDAADTLPENVLPSGLPEKGAPGGNSVHLSAVSRDDDEPELGVTGAAKKPANSVENGVLQAFQSGESGIRTRATSFPVDWISNPAHSATLPSLRTTCVKG